MRLAKSAAAAAMIGAALIGSYAAGRADASPSDAVAKLNQTYDLLVKARATLNAVSSNRAGYGNVEKAKASIDAAMAETQKAVAANGG